MAVKHTNPDSNESVVHKGEKGKVTGCGVDTNKNPNHWVDSHDKITCKNNGCKKG